ncbi:hypothetical protein OAJ12_02425 [Pelagibacteraceae bacterium]|nr:hypothetical protein [Pelagibacteraceae bacterium]
MKKIYDYLFLFSKFSISLILLICIIGLLYIFFVNYKNETKISQNKISNQNVLKQEIRNNLDLIKNISKEVKSTQSSLLDIKNSLTSISEKNSNNNNSKIIENIKILNNNFTNLSKEIENIKNNNLKSSSNNFTKQPNIVNDSRDEIIDLILIKYENNIDFGREIDYLKKILNEDEVTKFEKIMILINDPFKGYINLENIFSNESNVYLKTTINKNQGSLLSNIILPYLDVSPSTENNIIDNQVLLLKEIGKELENKNIQKVFEDLKSISNYETFFSESLIEINKYNKFTDALDNIN